MILALTKPPHAFIVAYSPGGDPAEWPESLRVREFPSLRKGPEVGK